MVASGMFIYPSVKSIERGLKFQQVMYMQWRRLQHNIIVVRLFCSRETSSPLGEMWRAQEGSHVKLGARTFNNFGIGTLTENLISL